MTHQEVFEFHTKGRGMSEVTGEVTAIVARCPAGAGVAHVFVRHSSCSLLITENAAPDVRRDLETLAGRWAPDGDPAYRHNLEGADDMAAHARSMLSGTFVTVPVSDGRLLLGTWHGIYLWEHRTRGHVREIVVTVLR
ncbi:secondary thiamine-phosphate synthase enzyme YjbQ [Aromatoleum sp.]|uniref:secondary thiamine-phosphate synthase enzyme YjbQ n=1 Tax=Aromatoleum sp. TaxID=2307007 RepID=UPI002FC89512